MQAALPWASLYKKDGSPGGTSRVPLVVPHSTKGDNWSSTLMITGGLRKEKLTHSGHHGVTVAEDREPLVQGTRRHCFVSLLVTCEGLGWGNTRQPAVEGCGRCGRNKGIRT